MEDKQTVDAKLLIEQLRIDLSNAMYENALLRVKMQSLHTQQQKSSKD
jgi:hypothetical protein